jgi:hypothetical protein
MIEFSLTTPAVLFPAVSLLMLAYTNRFLAISNLIRNLKKQYDIDGEEHLLAQIRSLRRRILLIRNMQFLGITSLFLCVLSMFFVFENQATIGFQIFGAALIALIGSLMLSLREIHLSVIALNLEMKDIEKHLVEKKNIIRKIEELEL